MHKNQSSKIKGYARILQKENETKLDLVLTLDSETILDLVCASSSDRRKFYISLDNDSRIEPDDQ